MNLYKDIFEALNSAEIEYMVIGGVAVNLYGYTRFTGDIDIILALNSQNLARMDKLMKNLGYYERLPISINELGDKKKLEKFIAEKGLKAYTYISNDRPELSIDVVVEVSQNFAKYTKGKTTIGVWDIDLPVIGIDDLIGLKKVAGRDKDLIDLEALLKLKEL